MTVEKKIKFDLFEKYISIRLKKKIQIKNKLLSNSMHSSIQKNIAFKNNI